MWGLNHALKALGLFYAAWEALQMVSVLDVAGANTDVEVESCDGFWDFSF